MTLAHRTVFCNKFIKKRTWAQSTHAVGCKQTTRPRKHMSVSQGATPAAGAAVCSVWAQHHTRGRAPKAEQSRENGLTPATNSPSSVRLGRHTAWELLKTPHKKCRQTDRQRLAHTHRSQPQVGHKNKPAQVSVQGLHTRVRYSSAQSVGVCSCWTTTNTERYQQSFFLSLATDAPNSQLTAVCLSASCSRLPCPANSAAAL